MINTLCEDQNDIPNNHLMNCIVTQMIYEDIQQKKSYSLVEYIFISLELLCHKLFCHTETKQNILIFF